MGKWHSKDHKFRRLFDFKPYGLSLHQSLLVPPDFDQMRDILITSIRGTPISFEVRQNPLGEGKTWLVIDFSKPLQFIYIYYNKECALCDGLPLKKPEIKLYKEYNLPLAKTSLSLLLPSL